MEIRKRIENQEKTSLSSFATLSVNSKGRKKEEAHCPIRTVFQRDRDRIIHSKAFRRLKHKTQVFLSPEGDHYRTRLTHTLEVAQVARTISRALQLNEDLTEAIALAHDLGHTPFGHAGESALNEICPLGFKHFEQSVRVVEVLEKNGEGLNLTFEVLDGILNHTRGELPKTLEGQVVRLADRIAYINHDIDDALRGHILKNSEIPDNIREILGETQKERFNNLIVSVIQNSQNGEIKMDNDINDAFWKLHSFMYDNVYLSENAKSEEDKVPRLIFSLYEYFKNNPNKLPVEMQVISQKENIDRAVCDYIAGMTDPFAILLFKKLFIPQSWNF